ncbi:MAG: DNA gyrase subunit B, partial [uncultured Solirubrobacteraceae bacterium]
ARRARGRPQAAGHVHRLDGRPRPAPPRLRGRRQLGRRGARRSLRRRRGHDPPGQPGHGHRQRPRHPRRDHGEGAEAGRRGRAH